MVESGEHHSQQTDMRTEYEIRHILTHRQVRKKEHMDTGKGVPNAEVYWGEDGRDSGGGELGRDSLGRNAKYG